MQAQNIIFPAQILRGAGAVSRIGEVCGLLGSRALIIGGHSGGGGGSAYPLSTGGIIGDGGWPGVVWRRVQRKPYSSSGASGAGHRRRPGHWRGWGKSLDTSKAVGVETRVPVVTVPTIAATCAAVTPLTVRYHDDGHFRDLFPLNQAPAVVIIDTEIIAAAPLRWLAAGLGDTLAKWYEFRYQRRAGQSQYRPSIANSRICYDLINTRPRRLRCSSQRVARCCAGASTGCDIYVCRTDLINEQWGTCCCRSCNL
jgi:glycerol dehydrogenase